MSPCFGFCLSRFWSCQVEDKLNISSSNVRLFPSISSMFFALEPSTSLSLRHSSSWFLVWDRLSVCGPDWPVTHYIDQVGFECTDLTCFCLLSPGHLSWSPRTFSALTPVPSHRTSCVVSIGQVVKVVQTPSSLSLQVHLPFTRHFT